MIQVCSVSDTTFAMMAEWALDWASPQGPILREVAGWYLEELEKLDQD